MSALDFTKALDPALLDRIVLTPGKHISRELGLCAMELVAWLDGEPHSNDPKCACPAIRAYVMPINDRGPQWVRDELKARALKIVGSRGSVELQKKRAAVFVRSAIAQAGSVLHIFEDTYPNDDRPRKAIEAAKALLAGEGTGADAARAADDASRAADAAHAAALAAADAARAPYSFYAAEIASCATDAIIFAIDASGYSACAAADAADASDAKDQHWRAALATLDEALSIQEAA